MKSGGIILSVWNCLLIEVLLLVVTFYCLIFSCTVYLSIYYYALQLLILFKCITKVMHYCVY